MNPGDLALDDLESPAGRVVRLGEMLLEHPLAKARLVPRDLFALGPRLRRGLAVNDVYQFHDVLLSTILAQLRLDLLL